MKEIFLALGSNLGNRRENINQAIELLDEHNFIEVEKVSSIIETEAVSNVSQPKFLNAAIKISTILSPRELLKETQKIETSLGRTSKGTNDPRTIDIDILFYGTDIICEEDLTIPHPLLHERSFVLIPLNEIAGNFEHPSFSEKISAFYEKVVGY